MRLTSVVLSAAKDLFFAVNAKSRSFAALTMTGAALTTTLPATAFAQIEHPISAELRLAPRQSETPGAKFSVTLAVTIPSSPTVWHLYSITQPPGGPIATTIKGGPASVFRLAGKIEGSAPNIADDPNFGMLTETHTDSVVYRIPLVAAPTATGKQRLAIALRYQTCNDRYCLPPVTDTIVGNIVLAGAAKTTVAFDSAKVAGNGESGVGNGESGIGNGESGSGMG
jgi:thiol:disulfide interchange protein DsbD